MLRDEKSVSGGNFIEAEKEKSPDKKEQAIARIEVLKSEIEFLEAEKTRVLAEIDQHISSQQNLNKKERQGEKAVKFIEFGEQEDVRELDFVKDENNFHFETAGRNGEKVIVSEGDLIADMEWGVFYNLEHTTVSKDIYKKYNGLRKRYTEAYYNKLIAQKRDESLILQRLYVDDIGRQDMFLAQAYESILESKKEEKEEKTGFIFEKIVDGLLQRISLDLGKEWGMEYIPADAVDDVEFKTDCIIKIKDKHHRGVGVEETEESETRGIQLTLRKSGDPDFDIKRKQIATVKKKLAEQGFKGESFHIDDLILLEVGAGNKEIREAYDEWKKSKKTLPGGPAKNFSVDQIVEILEGILSGTALDLKNRPDFKEALTKYFDKNNFKKR